MTTLNEMIEIIKTENSNGMRTGSDETGYTDLTVAEYEAKIIEWAKARLAKEAKAAKIEADVIAKAALFEKMGINADEAKLLLS